MSESFRRFDAPQAGAAMKQLMAELYPICRSITGNGIQESLQILQRRLALDLHQVPSGTPVFDWAVPKEWNVRDAFVKNAQGVKVIDFQRSNLHVVSYSVPVHCTMPLSELKQHLFSLPEHPDWIPYRTSYYKEYWGFCLSDRTLLQLQDGEYEVCIDSSLEDGHLTYGELLLPGKRRDEVLISCHCCHPSLCNDNLSGMVLATFLADRLRSQSLNYSYRFLFIPGTIGSITWLALHRDQAKYIKHGLIVACVGDSGNPTYKRSRQQNAEIDRAAEMVLRHSGEPYEILDFSPYGYDERQYCSPGFNLPVGSLTRTPHGRFPEYHTSADDLDLIRPEFLADSLYLYLAVINVLETNRTLLNTNPFCEPQLGKRGVYSSLGGRKESNAGELALLWVLNLSDGTNSLLDIAERSEMPYDSIREATDVLLECELLREVAGSKMSQDGSAESDGQGRRA